MLEGSQSHISHSLTFKCITRMLQWDYQLLQSCYYRTELLNTKRSYEIPEAIFSPGHQAKNNLFSSLESQMYKDMETGRRSIALLAKILLFHITWSLTDCISIVIFFSRQFLSCMSVPDAAIKWVSALS